jgi:hypothetical protein
MFLIIYYQGKLYGSFQNLALYGCSYRDLISFKKVCVIGTVIVMIQEINQLFSCK